MYKFDPARNKFVYRKPTDADIDSMILQRLMGLDSTIEFHRRAARRLERTVRFLNYSRIGCGVVALSAALLSGWAMWRAIAINHSTVWTGINAICFVVNVANAWFTLWKQRRT